MEQKNSFQIRLFKQLNEPKNIFISPISIYQALSLTANGAIGDTQTKMLTTLDSSSVDKLNLISKDELALMSKEEGIKYSIANAVLTKVKPTEEFQELAGSIYQTKVDILKDSEQVNTWCSEKTEGKITKLLDKVDESIAMIILNAIYFSGQWNKAFDDIGKDDFYLKNNSIIKASFMKKQLDGVSYTSTNTEELIGLKLKGTQFVFYIVLPKGDIDDYLNSFSDERFKSLNDQALKEPIELTMPKFKIEFGISLKSALIALGMDLPFESSANFKNISQEADLFIDDVIHKTYIKVDENGLEAAAATAVMMTRCMMPVMKEYKQVVVNRPFIVAIKHPESQHFLFIGKIENVSE
jgi:serpin B